MSLKRAEVGSAVPVAGELQHAFVLYSLTPGRCGYGPNLDELCGAMRPAHSPLAERRQRLMDEHGLDHGVSLDVLEGVVASATQVRMTDEIIASALAAREAHDMARAVLEAAGFEVIE